MHPELAELSKYVLGVLVLIVGFFIVRTLKKIDDNQKMLHESQCRLHERFDSFSREFYRMQGEHESMKASCRSIQAVERMINEIAIGEMGDAKR